MNWDAIFNGLLAIVLVIMSYDYYRLEMRMNSHPNPTTLGKAMESKYRALKYGIGILGLLYIYSTYFALQRSVGIFTPEIRNALRAVAFCFLLYAWWQMRRMTEELDDAERDLGGED